MVDFGDINLGSCVRLNNGRVAIVEGATMVHPFGPRSFVVELRVKIPRAKPPAPTLGYAAINLDQVREVISRDEFDRTSPQSPGSPR